MRILIVIILMFLTALAHGQTHTMPGSNVVPSGASLTINSGASITAAVGSTVTGFGGGGTVSLTATTPIIVTPSPITGTGVISLDSTKVTNWDTAFSQVRQWDGGATGLVAATGRTSLGLVVGTNVAPATSGSSILYGNGSGGFSNVTVGSGLSFTTGTLAASGTGGSQTFTVTDAGTATTTDVVTLQHNSSGTPANSFGTGIMFKGQTTTTINQIMGEVGFQWSSAADGTRKSFFYVEPAGVGGLLSTGMLQLYSDGGLNVSGYTITSPGANIINTATGYTVGQIAPTAGKILQSNGTSMIYSGQTWPTTAGTAGYTIRSDGTNFASYPQDMLNSSVASQATFSSSDLYVTGSNVVVAAGDVKAKGQYRCLFDMTKSAGTGAIVISLRVGTAGTTSDPAILTFTFTAGTSVADTGTFEIIATWRTVGSGTSAVMQGICRANKNTATAAGLWGVANDSQTIVATTSSGFNSSTATQIGISFNGSTAFAGTTTLVQASLLQ